mmetsp:Transcript_19993/g.69330  ORF Transcript_19993/g.69330 Transcript_19993/m.69330 type:complete len:213 (+) Transcript_19993:101-739(+)
MPGGKPRWKSSIWARPLAWRWKSSSKRSSSTASASIFSMVSIVRSSPRRSRSFVMVRLRSPMRRAQEMVSLPPPRTCSRRSLTIGPPPCWLEWLVTVRLRPSPEMTVDELIIVKDPPPPPMPRSWSRSMSMSPPKPPSMPPPIIWSMRAKGSRRSRRRSSSRRSPRSRDRSGRPVKNGSSKGSRPPHIVVGRRRTKNSIELAARLDTCTGSF